LFLSLHFNSVPRTSNGQEHEGAETYCLTPTGMPSNLVREFEDDPTIAFPNNTFDAANLYFAVRLHESLVSRAGLKDRGVRRARFMTVLQGQRRPAVLLEGGYLTHPVEAQRILTPSYRQLLAEAVAGALPET
jgi:N-acetylmuramoyl-L-alanine amidase